MLSLELADDARPHASRRLWRLRKLHHTVDAELTARAGDGFQFGATGPAVRAQWEQVKELLAKEGRSAQGFGAEATVDYSAGPDLWRAEVEAWRSAGGTHFSLRAMDTAAEAVGAKRVGYAGPRDYVKALEEFAAVVG